jgi:hypothetical protein
MQHILSIFRQMFIRLYFLTPHLKKVLFFVAVPGPQVFRNTSVGSCLIVHIFTEPVPINTLRQ